MPEKGGRQMIGFARRAAIFPCVAALATLDHANAQPGEDFYRGHSIYVLFGSGPGSGCDVYARALVRYWAQHIPGNPTVDQNMPGAGGVTMSNDVADAAKPHGAILGAGFADRRHRTRLRQGQSDQTRFAKAELDRSISPQTMVASPGQRAGQTGRAGANDARHHDYDVEFDQRDLREYRYGSRQ
jgi:hypothetical protein